MRHIIHRTKNYLSGKRAGIRKSFKLTAIFLAIALVVWGWFWISQTMANIYYELGRLYGITGDHLFASQALEYARSYKSGDFDIDYALAVEYLKTGNFAGVEKIVASGIKGPDKIDYMYIDALLKQGQSKWDEAEQAFKRLIELAPADSKYYDALGSLYIEKERFTEAEEVFKKGIAIDGVDSALHDGLGVVYEHQGKMDLAEQEYKKALEINPDDISAQRNYQYIRNK